MKLRKREQFICCLLVVILFFAGMCVEISPAGSFFSYTKEVETSSVPVSVIRDGSNLTRLEPVCVISALRRDTSVRPGSNRGRFVVVFLAIELLLAHIFYFGESTELACRNRISRQMAIIRYIQQKDGKK